MSSRRDLAGDVREERQIVFVERVRLVAGDHQVADEIVAHEQRNPQPRFGGLGVPHHQRPVRQARFFPGQLADQQRLLSLDDEAGQPIPHAYPLRWKAFTVVEHDVQVDLFGAGLPQSNVYMSVGMTRLLLIDQLQRASISMVELIACATSFSTCIRLICRRVEWSTRGKKACDDEHDQAEAVRRQRRRQRSGRTIPTAMIASPDTKPAATAIRRPSRTAELTMMMK